MTPADRSIGVVKTPDCTPGRLRPDAPDPVPKEEPMPADPLDKQLVEAVLSRPRRAKADLEEAKLAGLRPARGRTAVAEADDDDDDDTDLDLGPEATAAAAPTATPKSSSR